MVENRTDCIENGTEPIVQSKPNCKLIIFDRKLSTSLTYDRNLNCSFRSKTRNDRGSMKEHMDGIRKHLDRANKGGNALITT